MSHLRRVDIGFADSPAIDAFSRLRISSQQNIFNSTFQYDLDPRRYNSIVANSGTVTHLPNESSAQLATAAVASSSAILQSKKYLRYIPGKSQLVAITGVVKAAVAGIVKRVGYFDANDGIFIEQNGTTDLALVRRTSTSGSAVDNRVVQASWNLDRLNGSGVVNPSGITLDLTKAMILVIDLQWLGMGRVRVGFSIGGVIVYVHEFRNANVLTTVYMKTAQLPIRWEIAGNGVATMQATCASVSSESEQESDQGIIFATDNGTTPRTFSAGTPLPIIAVRPRSTFNSLTNRIGLELESFSYAMDAGAGRFKWHIQYDCTITGGAWANVDTTNSAAEVNVTGTALSGGITIMSGYDNAADTAKQLQTILLNKHRYPWCLDGAGNQITIAIVGTELSGNSDMLASMRWRELR